MGAIGLGILFIAAVLPVFLLLLFVYLKDYHKEPIGLLIKLFFFGVLSVVPIVIVELILQVSFEITDDTSILMIFVNTLISIALVEEGFKWIVAKFLGYNDKEFDEIYDVIVYAVFVSLGFACLENILYVFQNGLGNAIMRAFTSIPGHTCFGISMGYFFAKAKIASLNNNDSLYKRNLVLSIAVPILLHTLYDGLLFSVLIIPFFIFHIGMVIMGFIGVNKVSKMQVNFSGNIASGNIVNNNGTIQYIPPSPNQLISGVSLESSVNNNTGVGTAVVGAANTAVNSSSNYVNSVTIIPSPGVPTNNLPKAVDPNHPNFCPVCGSKNRGGNFCSSCGYKFVQ